MNFDEAIWPMLQRLGSTFEDLQLEALDVDKQNVWDTVSHCEIVDGQAWHRTSSPRNILELEEIAKAERSD